MKATLIAAAFLIPTLVLANDPSSTKTTKDTKDTYGQTTGSQTPNEVLNNIHKFSQKGIEKATLAQANAGNERVKNFAGRQLKDFQKLDKAVLDLAKDKKITLTTMSSGSAGSHEYGSAGSQSGSMGSTTTGSGSIERDTTMESDTTGSGSTTTGTTGSTKSGSVGTDTTGTGSSDRMGSTDDMGSTTTGTGTTGSRAGTTGTGTTGSTGTDTRTGSAGSGTTGSTGSTTQTGTANDTRTGTNNTDLGTGSSDTRMGSTTGSSDTMEMQDTRWDRLRTLKGAEFDSEYLSMTAEGARKNISVLEGARIKGDRKLDKVIDQAVRIFRDHQDQAEKLQRDIRAS
jgi:predicted outer membrane protein